MSDSSYENGYRPVVDPRMAEVRATLETCIANQDPETLAHVVRGLRNSNKYPDLDTLLIELDLEAMCVLEYAGILYSDVKRKPINWLWPGRIPFGKLTAMDGDPNYGKSSILCDVSAKYTRGLPMPEEQSAACAPGGVVLCMMEDDPADTLHDRLTRAGADLTRIVHLGEIPAGVIEGIPITRSFNLQKDIRLLIREIKRVNAGLVVLDPLAGLVGPASTNKSDEMYTVLDPIAAIARVMGVAVVFTRHLNKQQSEHSLYRGSGSMAIIGRARVGLICSDDPEDDTIKVLANHKNNLLEKAPGLSYQICNDREEGDPRPYVLWRGINKHSLKELFTLGPKPVADLGSTMKEIITAMETTGEPITPAQVYSSLREEHPTLTPENVRVSLSRLKKMGYVTTTRDYGKYILLISSTGDPVTPVTPVTVDDEEASEADLEGEGDPVTPPVTVAGKLLQFFPKKEV